MLTVEDDEINKDNSRGWKEAISRVKAFVAELADMEPEPDLEQQSLIKEEEEEAADPDKPTTTRCRRCGRVLTAPESVARGIGPICAEKVEVEGGGAGGEEKHDHQSHSKCQT